MLYEVITILVKDSPGFLVNRLLGAYLNEACQVAAAGVQWTSLDVITSYSIHYTKLYDAPRAAVSALPQMTVL